MKAEFPILEFDPVSKAVTEPGAIIKEKTAPEHCVICFFAEVIDDVVKTHAAHEVAVSKSEVGRHPLYEIEHQGQRLAFFHPAVGAPLAIGLLEEMIAHGCTKFIVCGGCGVLDKEIAVGHLLLPLAAIRDEGTSYHYLPPSREVQQNPQAAQAIEKTLQAHHIEYLRTKTWTTDAFYRETVDKIKLRKAEGCLCVEMEAAAFFAVAEYRNVTLGQILYGGDAVIEGDWDWREWNERKDIRHQLFWLAAEACLKL